jgi:ComF family protein
MTREGPERFAFTAAVSALLYDRRAEALITAYKDENERRLAHELACLLAASLPDEWRQWADALTWVPADAQARRRRGFDHMQMVAVELGDMSGIACMGLLSKQPLADQRSLSRRQRRANVSGLFSLDLTPPGNLATEALPQRILIIDDVFTTGATLDAAVSALIGAGVSEVRAVTVARVW